MIGWFIVNSTERLSDPIYYRILKGHICEGLVIGSYYFKYLVSFYAGDFDKSRQRKKCRG